MEGFDLFFWVFFLGYRDNIAEITFFLLENPKPEKGGEANRYFKSN